MQFSIYPPPKSAKFRQTSSKISNRRFLILSKGHSLNFLYLLTEFTTQVPQDIEITYGKQQAETSLLTIHLKKARKKHPESYEISSTKDGLSLTAPTEIGLFRGLASLKQIFRHCLQALPYFEINDEPDFKNRGVMLDVSRCKVPTIASLKKLIDRFADLKYNQLQLYTEHTFQFSQHPVVWSGSSAYSAIEMMEIQQYCTSKYIELIPCLNCFGHFERWLKHADYKPYAECPDGFIHPLTQKPIATGSTLRPNQKSLKLLNELYTEYLPLFKSSQFNVGGDEPWELGKGGSEEKCKAEGRTKVYVDFMLKVKNLSEKHGKKMMFWSDIVLEKPDSLKTLSKDLIAMNWGYEANHPFKKECEQVNKQGIPYYVCPGTSSWNSLTGRTENMLKNLSSAAKNGLKNNAIGYLVTDWGDYGHHQYLPISYPGYALGACESWNHKGSKSIDMADLLENAYFGEVDKFTANLILQTGRLTELSGIETPNSTLFNKLLFSKLRAQGFSKFDDKKMNECLKAFENIRSQLSGVSDHLIRGELENALSMATHSINRLKQSRGVNLEKGLLRNELAKIINNHESLWLARNRPGGLAESVAYLENSHN